MWRQDPPVFPSLPEVVGTPVWDELDDLFGRSNVRKALRAVEDRSESFCTLPPELQSNEDFMKMAVHKNPTILRYVPNNLKNKLEWESFLLETLRNHNLVGMTHASPEQRASKDFVMRAVNAWGMAISWCSNELKRDVDVALAAIRQRPSIVQSVLYTSCLLDSRSFWKRAIALRPDVVRFAPDWVRDDDELVQLAVRLQAHLLKAATWRLRDDPVTVRIAVAHRGMALVHATPTLRGDPGIVRLAVQSHPFALVYARDALRCDYSGFVRRAALFCHWQQARLVLVGATKQGEDSRCPFSLIETDLAKLVLNAFASAHTAPTAWARSLCAGDGSRQAYYVCV